MDTDKNRASIENMNYHLLDRLVQNVEDGCCCDMAMSVPYYREEYFILEKKLKILFNTILEERDQLFDYMTISLKRGGFYHRGICELLGIYSFAIRFPAQDSIYLENYKTQIVYENNTMKIFSKSFVPFICS